ncbi:putative spermidine/putrescine transport system substrate-binding protein [Enhydrobacter aerosaccus]|uniref:Putative spermidine/putrescine transport system substrate-binding protein n=1 Tax=Enhydrobacter aerosaccus TaxID=225324 RepID=A0A1T4R7N6_9HYPH|nr:extracellular solute-binding protein [Enhydrobacter aerosaccus]SKA11836.1 putative spermidine/putrescine transport system substrate-binding protein [Enhydrobacter aerosaccus]
MATSRKSSDKAADSGMASSKAVSRRAVMRGGAALAGAAGANAVAGFPTIWAQEIKDIELRHVGVSYSVVKAIGDQASKDLGFKVTMQNLDTSAAINRFITQPATVDIADVEGWQAKLATKRGVLQGIEVAKIKEFNNILPIFTKGEIDGHKIPRQGISPYEAMYIEKPDSKDLHEGVTGWMTFLPQVYNADSIGYRPDLVQGEVTEWKELINPKYKGKAAILDVPAIGIMDAALCFESAGLMKYGNKGNMTKAEIDGTIDKLIELKKNGHFRATWTTFDQSVQLMAAGEVVIQSMWSPAVAAVRVKSIPCVYAPVNIKNGKEGYRGWCNGMALMSHLSGKKRDAAYEYLNWYLSGWQGGFVARYGYYSPVPSTAKKFLTPAEWDYWYEGKPATQVVLDPYGVPMEQPGAKRDGGSFIDRVTNISCWNTLMDEAAYMNKRWNDFKVA